MIEHTIKIKQEEKKIQIPDGHSVIAEGNCQVGDLAWDNVKNEFVQLTEKSLQIQLNYKANLLYCLIRQV